jgi:hypothetical protein
MPIIVAFVQDYIQAFLWPSTHAMPIEQRERHMVADFPRPVASLTTKKHL